MVAELCFWVYCSSLLCPFTHPAMGNVAGAGAGVTGWFEPCARQTCSGCTKRNLPAVVVAWDPGAANAPVRAGFSAVLLQGGGGGGEGVAIVLVLVCSCQTSSHYSCLELSQAWRQSATEGSVGLPLRDVWSLESSCSREALQWAELRLFQAAQLWANLPEAETLLTNQECVCIFPNENKTFYPCSLAAS